jgi:subtilase family serine protease
MFAVRSRRKIRPSRSSPAVLFETLESRCLLSAASSGILHDDMQILANSTSASDIQGFTPSEIKNAYDSGNITFDNGTAKGDGSGQTIAIVDAYNAPYIVSDLGIFDAQFGLSAPPSLKIVNENGGSKLPPTNADWAGEISLDVEWAHAIAPGANILLVEASSATYNDLLAGVNYARHASGVSVVSMSWGGSEFFSFNGSEFTGETQYDPDFTTPSGHNGVTFVASAGDSGEQDPGAVQWPAISPDVLSVGGTSLYTKADGTYSTEYSWIGTNGGFSQIESTPAYQSVVDPTPTRASPDVAYVADPNTGVAVFDSLNDGGYVGWQVVGGTSVGSPSWAALIAIADQGRASLGQGTLNGAAQTLPILYSLYSAPGTSGYSTYASYFNDIIDPRDFYDAAAAGYDLLTGLGTPKAANVVDALAGITPGSQPVTPTPPTTPTLPASSIEATVVSDLPAAAVGLTGGSMTLRLFNTASGAFDGPLSIALYATGDGSITSADTPFQTIRIKKVAVGSNKSTTVVVHFRYPTNVPNGSYQFAAAVTTTGTGTAPTDAVSPNSVTLEAPVVDLSATAVRSSVVVDPGHRGAVKLLITNTGNYIASGMLTLNLYSSTDATLDASDPLLTFLAKKIALAPGTSKLLTLRFLAPSSLTAGAYHLIAAASSSVRPPDVDAGDKIVVINTKG